MVNPIHLSREQKAADARGEETKGEGRRVVNPLYARMSSSSFRGASVGSLRSLGSFGSFSSSNASFMHTNAMSGGDSTRLVDELTSSANVATGATGDAAVGVRAPAEERHAELVEEVDQIMDGTGGTDGTGELGGIAALANNSTSSIDRNGIKEKEEEEDKQPVPWTNPSIDPVVETEAEAEAKAAAPQTNREINVAAAATRVALMSTRTQSIDIDILDEEEGGYGDFTSDVTPNSLYTEGNSRSVCGEVEEGAFVGGAHSGGDGGEYTYNTESGGHGGYDEHGGSYDDKGQFTEHGGYDEHGGYYDEHGQYVGHNEHGEYGGHEGRWGHEMTTPIVDAAEANAAPEEKLGNDHVVDLVKENVTDNTPSNTIANDTIGNVQDDNVGDSGYSGSGGGSSSILRTATAAANAAVPPSKSDAAAAAAAAAAASHGRQRAASLSLQSARARLRRIIGEGAESATLGGDDADDESARLRLAQ
jgi:hypothetical protein